MKCWVSYLLSQFLVFNDGNKTENTLEDAIRVRFQLFLTLIDEDSADS